MHLGRKVKCLRYNQHTLTMSRWYTITRKIPIENMKHNTEHDEKAIVNIKSWEWMPHTHTTVGNIN